MRIEVRLCNSLACRSRQNRAFSLTFRAGVTVGEVLARLNLPHGILHLALCNGRTLLDENNAIDGSQPLVDGDHLVLGAAGGELAVRPSPLLPLPGLIQRLGSLLSPSVQAR